MTTDQGHSVAASSWRVAGDGCDPARLGNAGTGGGRSQPGAGSTQGTPSLGCDLVPFVLGLFVFPSPFRHPEGKGFTLHPTLRGTAGTSRRNAGSLRGCCIPSLRRLRQGWGNQLPATFQSKQVISASRLSSHSLSSKIPVLQNPRSPGTSLRRWHCLFIRITFRKTPSLKPGHLWHPERQKSCSKCLWDTQVIL